jgi:peptidoglycan/xylan/chitin deacetylase (PgdA/CDA1 family)
MRVKPPYIARVLFPQLLWEVDTDAKEIFLTFDDGPHPEITPRVLEILDEFNAKATFFCVGDNVEKYPETYAAILEKGHKTGNHSFNHLNGWKTKNKDYFENIEQCRKRVDSDLFRPPYGRIKPTQLEVLNQQYNIVMWSVLSYDFDKNTSPGQCIANAIRHTKSGSIVVFHDSEKARKNLLFALPKFLETFTKQGFLFPVLSENKGLRHPL